jgi:hypothetical protein
VSVSYVKLSGQQKRVLIAAWKKPSRRISRGEMLSDLMREQRDSDRELYRRVANMRL